MTEERYITKSNWQPYLYVASLGAPKPILINVCLASGSSLCSSGQFIQMTRKIPSMFSLIKTQAPQYPQSPEREKCLSLILVQGYLGSISSQDDLQWDWSNPFLGEPTPAMKVDLSSGQPTQNIRPQ